MNGNSTSIYKVFYGKLKHTALQWIEFVLRVACAFKIVAFTCSRGPAEGRRKDLFL